MKRFRKWRINIVVLSYSMARPSFCFDIASVLGTPISFECCWWRCQRADMMPFYRRYDENDENLPPCFKAAMRSILSIYNRAFEAQLWKSSCASM